MLGYFSLLREDRQLVDVFIRAEEAATAADLLAALGIDPGTVSAWELGGRVLGPRDRLAELAIEGGVLRRSAYEHQATPPVRTTLLQITAGPDAGRTWHLADGRYVIGRAPECEIAVAADPQCSRRHAVLVVADGEVTIEDLGAANGVVVGGRRLRQARVSFDMPVQLGETVLTLSPPQRTDGVVAGDGTGGRAFSRPPRLRASQPTVTVNLPGRPAERGKIPIPLVATVAPLLIGVLMAVLLHQLEYLLFTAMSPVIAFANHFSSRRQGTRSHRQKLAEHDRLTAVARAEIAEAIAREEAALRTAHPDPAVAAAVAAGPQRRLWERRRDDADFLVLRLGLTDRPASVVVNEPPPDPDQVVSADDERRLHQVPETLRLPEAGVVGIAGPAEQSGALARWMLAQIAVWHAPDDVAVAILGSAGAPERWAWARWLPHARTDRERCVASVALTDEAVRRLATSLAAEVDARTVAQGTASPGTQGSERSPIVVVIDGVYRLGSLPQITRVLRGGPPVGVYVLCIEESEHFLPEECRAAAVFDPVRPTRLTTKGIEGTPTRDGRDGRGASGGYDVLADLVALPWCEACARSMAPLRLTRGQEAAAAVPTSLRLLQELDLDPPDPARIAQRWAAGGRTTMAPIGRTAAGPLEFDLSRHGPHGLVAGTTGSGKSELLQTVIASLAVANRPDAMTFVLVDYKGGSAFKDCARLPHTVGLVTDLDGHLTERALVSLGAELRRREHILLAAQAKDIEDLVRQCQRNGTDPPLARLAIVIDEFASLVEELPGFVDGLVDIARRGRSLGIHLLLATQRPAGVVSAPIKANTNFRIAMRVTDATDSSDVIDSPLAARIPKDIPGRAYLRVGHEQLTEFQAARVGGFRRTSGHRRGLVEAFAVGLRELVTEAPRRAGSESDTDETDLSALVEAVNQATASAGIVPAQSPWLDPLPEVTVLGGQVTASLCLAYGTEDFPEEQRQAAATWDLERSSHMIVAGDAGSGRSTFLRALAAALARQASPADAHLYGIDCGNGMLGPLEALPHCGVVASRIETDRVERLLSRIGGEIARRQQVLARGGFSSIADQRRAAPPGDALPYLLLLVDRWEGFVSMFETLDNGRLVQEVLHLMREGVGAGLRVVLAGDRSVLASRIASLADQVLVLRMNDRTTYGSAGINPRQVPDHQPPGRALRAYGRTELQVAMLDRETNGPAQVTAFLALAEEAVARWHEVPEEACPAPIGVLPALLELSDDLLAASSGAGGGAGPSGGAPIVVGVGGDRVAPCTVELGVDTPTFVVAGPQRSGRSNLLLLIAHQALRHGIGVVVVTARPSPLRTLADRPGVLGILDAASVTPTELATALESEPPLMVVVDDAELVTRPELSEHLVDFLRRSRDTQRSLVLGGTTADMGGGFKGFVPEARKAQTGVLLCPGSSNDGDALGIRVPKTALCNGPAGRGILVHRQSITPIQVPRYDVDEAIAADGR